MAADRSRCVGVLSVSHADSFHLGPMSGKGPSTTFGRPQNPLTHRMSPYSGEVIFLGRCKNRDVGTNIGRSQRNPDWLSPSPFPLDWSHKSQILVLGTNGTTMGGGCIKEGGCFEVKIFSEVVTTMYPLQSCLQQYDIRQHYNNLYGQHQRF